MSTEQRSTIFSFWAWLVLAPPLITAWGGYEGAQLPSERLSGLVAAIIVHLAVGACFWIASVVERRTAGPARWAWIVAVLLIVAAVRPSLGDLLHVWAGIDIAQPPFLLRVVLNVIGVGVVTVIVHLALDQVTRAAESRRRIAAVLDRTEQQYNQTEVRRAALIVEYQRTIADPIRQAIARVRADAPPRQVAAELMRVVGDVIRPLTDRTFAMGDDATEYQYRPPGPAPEGRTVPRLAGPQRIEATTPWGPAAVWFALQLPMALLAPEQLLGVALTLASTAIVLLCSWLVGRQPLPESPLSAIALLGIEYAAIGALGTLLIALPALDTTPPGYWVYGILLYTVLGTTLSIGRSRTLDYLASEEQLVTSLLDARYQANAAHGRLAETTNLLARRLHAAIQADVVAAALQLRIGDPDPAAIVTELRARIEHVLAAPMLPTPVDADHGSDRPSAEGIRAATHSADEAWQEALDLTTDYDEDLWQWLTEHPWQRAFIREVCTRGLTNIVRYGRTRKATVAIGIDEGRLRIEIRSPGRIMPRDQRLTTIAELAGRTQLAELVEDGPDVVYRVVA